jgi:hypothetical protein
MSQFCAQVAQAWRHLIESLFGDFMDAPEVPRHSVSPAVLFSDS